MFTPLAFRLPAATVVTHRAFVSCRHSLFAVALALLAVGCASPRNVILMIGDGMGPDSVAAAGAYRFGPAHRAAGGQERLALETLPYHCFVTTFSAEGKGYDPTWHGGSREYPTADCTDSAAAATAIGTGVKTTNRALGVDPQDRPLVTILELAQQRGLKTGLVTTVPFCHATPAAFACHQPRRDQYLAIGHEILFRVQPDVVIGAGHPGHGDKLAFDYITQADWEAIVSGKTPYLLLQTRDDFRHAATQPPVGKLFGAFQSHGCLPYRKADGSGAKPDMPTLAELTDAALTSLTNRKGFFLMVEGGSIDSCNHGNDLDGSIGETLGFNAAVAAVQAWIKAHGGPRRTLLLVTADHETGYLHDVQAKGVGELPAVQWGLTGKYGGHTNRLVDLYLQGPGANGLAARTRKIEDFERGAVSVIDDTVIFQIMKDALPPTRK